MHFSSDCAFKPCCMFLHVSLHFWHIKVFNCAPRLIADWLGWYLWFSYFLFSILETCTLCLITNKFLKVWQARKQVGNNSTCCTMATCSYSQTFTSLSSYPAFFFFFNQEQPSCAFRYCLLQTCSQHPLQYWKTMITPARMIVRVHT